MTLKRIIRKLEHFTDKQYPHYKAKFYSNRRNNYIHLGLDVNLFPFEDYKTFLNYIDQFLSQELHEHFYRIDPPKLEITTR